MDSTYNIQDRICRDHFIQTWQSLVYCKQFDDIIVEQDVFLKSRNNEQRRTLIFDLDETLIHCNESIEQPYDIKMDIEFEGGEVIQVGINIRPYAKECLQKLSKIYEVVVFTASHSFYADKILDYLDPNNEYISDRLYRDQCSVSQQGIHLKDLRIIKNRGLKNILLVDNSAYSFGIQISNGIPILPFYDDKNDKELQDLTQFLININLYQYKHKDVREINKEIFRLEEIMENDNFQEIYSNILQKK